MFVLSEIQETISDIIHVDPKDFFSLTNKIPHLVSVSKTPNEKTANEKRQG